MGCGALASWDRTSENMLRGFSKEGSQLEWSHLGVVNWELTGGFSLRFEDLTITRRYILACSITWILLLMTA